MEVALPCRTDETGIAQAGVSHDRAGQETPEEVDLHSPGALRRLWILRRPCEDCPHERLASTHLRARDLLPGGDRVGVLPPPHGRARDPATSSVLGATSPALRLPD